MKPRQAQPVERLIQLDGDRGILFRGRRIVDPSDLFGPGKVEWDDGHEVRLSDEERERLAFHPAPAVERPAPRDIEDPWDREVRLQREEIQATIQAAERFAAEQGEAIQQKAREELAKRQREEEQATRLLRITRYGIPRELAANLQKAQQERPATIAVREWMATDKPALLLFGASQAGKSHAAARWVISKPHGLFVQGTDLELAVRPDSDGSGVALLKRCREAQHLVIDEAAGKIGPAAMEQIDTLISLAFDRRRRLIVTCNAHSLEDFYEYFGEGDRNRVRARFERAGKALEIGPWKGTGDL